MQTKDMPIAETFQISESGQFVPSGPEGLGSPCELVIDSEEGIILDGWPIRETPWLLANPDDVRDTNFIAPGIYCRVGTFGVENGFAVLQLVGARE